MIHHYLNINLIEATVTAVVCLSVLSWAVLTWGK